MAEKRSPAGLIGLLFVLSCLLVALAYDRVARGQAEAAAGRVARLIGMTEEESLVKPNKAVELQNGTATRDEVEAAIGKKPEGALVQAGNQQYEIYTFGRLRRYPLYVYYTRGVKPALIRYSLYRKG